jgi:hypothetical protein
MQVDVANALSISLPTERQIQPCEADGKHVYEASKASFFHSLLSLNLPSSVLMAELCLISR